MMLYHISKWSPGRKMKSEDAPFFLVVTIWSSSGVRMNNVWGNS